MKKKHLDIILRYALILIVLFMGVNFSYFIFSEPTVNLSYYLIKSVHNSAVLLGADIFIEGKIISIVGACIAGSAYLLLFVLNLSIPNITIEKRIYMVLGSFLIFFLLNILRIFYLAVLYINESAHFDFSHKVLWYFGSTIMIVLLWFLEVWIFRIKEIPIYSDVKEIFKIIKS